MSSKFRKLMKFLPNFFMVLGAVSVAFAMLLSMVNLPVSAQTEHCPGGWVYKDEKGKSEGAIPDGLSVNISGATVTFNKNVSFCVKASNSVSGVISGVEYTVTFDNNGGQTPEISYVVVYEVIDEGGDDDPVITPLPPVVTLSKSVEPKTLPEPGGEFTFTLTITNNSNEDVEITSLTDNHTLSTECNELVGDVIGKKGSTSCTYKVTKSVEGVYNNTANVMVENEWGSDTASASASFTVTKKPDSQDEPSVTLVKSVDQTTLPGGGDFTFTLLITNTSDEEVTITQLKDDYKLSDECGALVDTVISAGGSASCDYIVNETVVGKYDNTASVKVENDGGWAIAEDDATFTVTDGQGQDPNKPKVTLNKSVIPFTRPEPGGDFTFTLIIQNDSTDPVTITQLKDDYKLSDECNALIDTVIPASGSVSCEYIVNETIVGEYDNTASVKVENEEGSATAKDDATFIVTDVETTEEPGDPEPSPTPDPTDTPDDEVNNEDNDNQDNNDSNDPSDEGDDEDNNDSQTQLDPPTTTGNPTVLIPVTGIEFGTPMNKVQSVAFNLGLGLLGLGLVLQSIRKKIK